MTHGTAAPFNSQVSQSGVEGIWPFYVNPGFYFKWKGKPQGDFKAEKDKINL